MTTLSGYPIHVGLFYPGFKLIINIKTDKMQAGFAHIRAFLAYRAYWNIRLPHYFNDYLLMQKRHRATPPD
jgi:hypothetical protein